MAKVLGNPYGEFRGKLGGSVFSKNKAGPFARQYVVPSNPSSLAQTRQRGAFASITGAFRSLDVILKEMWQEYANNYFVPKNAINTGQYSGYQAFMGLNRPAIFGSAPYPNGGKIVYDFTAPNLIGGVSFLPFVPNLSSNPNAYAFSGLIGTSAGNFAMTLENASVTIDKNNDQFQALIDLQVGDGSGVNMDNNNVTPEGDAIGYAVFMSNGNPQRGLVYSNPERYLLGYFPAWEADDVSDLSSVTKITAETDEGFGMPTNLYKQIPIPGETVLITVYAMSTYGAMRQIGAYETPVTEIP